MRKYAFDLMQTFIFAMIKTCTHFIVLLIYSQKHTDRATEMHTATHRQHGILGAYHIVMVIGVVATDGTTETYTREDNNNNNKTARLYETPK